METTFEVDDDDHGVYVCTYFALIKLCAIRRFEIIIPTQVLRIIIILYTATDNCMQRITVSCTIWPHPAIYAFNSTPLYYVPRPLIP